MNSSESSIDFRSLPEYKIAYLPLKKSTCNQGQEKIINNVRNVYFKPTNSVQSDPLHGIKSKACNPNQIKIEPSQQQIIEQQIEKKQRQLKEQKQKFQDLLSYQQLLSRSFLKAMKIGDIKNAQKYLRMKQSLTNSKQIKIRWKQQNRLKDQIQKLNKQLQIIRMSMI